MIEKYEILNSPSVLDIPDSKDYDEQLEELYDQQTKIIKKELEPGAYKIAINGKEYYEVIDRDDILYYAGNYLAVKEGCDVVRFIDGNIGVVAYYGNRDEEYIEVLRKATDADLDESLNERVERFKEKLLDITLKFILDTEDLAGLADLDVLAPEIDDETGEKNYKVGDRVYFPNWFVDEIRQELEEKDDGLLLDITNGKERADEDGTEYSDSINTVIKYLQK